MLKSENSKPAGEGPDGAHGRKDHIGESNEMIKACGNFCIYCRIKLGPFDRPYCCWDCKPDRDGA